ncbi:hypothetical protein Goshw_000041 [Gossypium schwendimanii]|uniref:Uncharacterized protein n=2 Tax=Gossypium TaxID=3633 RepID=A0A7J9LD36_GOSSC|nr:hypothetical protein [Gossypium schwendimanii]
MTNFLSYTKKIEPLGKMLKQLLMLLKKLMLRMYLI